MSRVSAGFRPHPEPEALLGPVRDRFGFPSGIFAEHTLWHRPRAPAVWIVRQGCQPPEGIRVEALGLLMMRRPPPRGFPTTGFCQRFGGYATRNIYEFDQETALHLMAGGTLSVEPQDWQGGPYIVRIPEAVVGRGWVREGQLRLDCPKVWRHQLFSS